MNNRLSNSSINKYLTCPTAWKLHYKEGYRTPKMKSALLFGSAVDKAIEYLVTKNDDEEHSKYATAEQCFDYHFTHQYVNNELVNIFELAPEVEFSKKDVDTDLLTEEEMEDESRLWWYSLRKKGHLIVQAARYKVLPLITQVHSTQEKTELKNDEGDSSIGYCDGVFSFEGYNKPVITDFKTASRPYALDSVKESAQLIQYLHDLSDKYEGTRLAAYVVFLKNPTKTKTKICVKCGNDGSGKSHKTCDNIVDDKRCHGEWDIKTNFDIEVQVIIDEIPLDKEEIILDNIEMVNNAIKSGVFYKNISKCKDTGFGSPCEFYNLCWNNSEEGLIKKEMTNA